MKNALILFILRMFFYLSVTALILIHPGIPVSFDNIGLLQWFVIIPYEAVIAFLPAGVIRLRSRFLVAFLPLLPLSIWAGGFGPGALQPLIAGVLSFTLTFLLFHYPRWGKLSILEPFFLAWVCLRLLALSRSGEDIAGQGAVLTQFIFVWTGVVFLLSGVVVYFCLYPQSSVGAKKESLFFLCASLAAFILVLAVLPADFVRNTIIKNLIPDKVPEMIGESSERGVPKDSSDGKRSRDSSERGNGRETIPGNGKGQRQGKLRGISEHNWPDTGTGGGGDRKGDGEGRGNRGNSRGDGANRGGNSGGDSRQYMVKIVASKYEPVYMGDSFNGNFDPVEGFLPGDEEPLNELASRRLFVTWFNNERVSDKNRRRREIFSLSTLQQKYLPYRPVSIDPTILNENAGPLRYIHQIVSDVHLGDPLELVHVPGRLLNAREKSSLAHYLEFPLENEDRKSFSGFLDDVLRNWHNNKSAIISGNRYLMRIFSGRQNESETYNEFLETILAMLTGFSVYQYNLGDVDDTTVANIKDFLFSTKEGDCDEFSNSLAMLGRLAGIPSRVVTGYLAAESLQTPAHLRGLAVLQEKIPVLQGFDFDDLYMVTTAHKHSWTQFYIPDYGWLDFEATAFAIPPEPGMDIGTWDVVIPILDETKVFSQVRKFPWQAVLKTAGMLATMALLCAYALRYGREAVLRYSVRRGGREGARSLYLLLLARLAADGKPIKPAAKTALEYAELFPGMEKEAPFDAFSAAYSELRWREFKDNAEKDERFLTLKKEYSNILKTTRRKGLPFSVARIFSLRGLAYL